MLFCRVVVVLIDSRFLVIGVVGVVARTNGKGCGCAVNLL